MQDEQPAIYYMTGEKIAEMERESAMEVFKKKNLKGTGVPINKVEVSRRLVNSPAVVVATEYGMSARQERINKVQDQDPTYFSEQQKVLEINANHPTIYDLLQKVNADPDDEAILDTATLVAQAAVLSSNYDLEDPETLVSSVYELIAMEHGLDPKADVTPIEVELPEEKKAEDVDDDDEEEDGADDDDDAKDGDKPEL